MKYTTEIEINLPRKETVSLYNSTDNLFKWMPGLKSFDHVSGEPGEKGAKSKLVFDMNGRIVEMLETILENKLPDEFHCTYDAKGVHNIVESKFIDQGNTTKWIMTSDFQFSGLMKLMDIFMKGAFPKQTFKSMNQFKHFAENN